VLWVAVNRIKGITVEIGGDTTKLQTALKGVNTEIRNTQSQLRDVEKLLKLDPGNTELLAQKHWLLRDAVRETKEKPETLKMAAEQANTALANGEISQEQYDALQREIIEMENALKSLEQQANQSVTAVQKIAATGEKLKTVGDNISSVGQKFLPVTGAVACLGMVKTAFSALGAVLAANPIILIVAAVAAAVAAIVLLYQKCEWFRDAVNAVWSAVKDFFVAAWKVICSFFTETIPNVWNSLVSFFGQVPAWWSGLWKSVGDFFGNIWMGMMNNPVLSGIVTLIRSLWENLWATLWGIWQGIQMAASGAWELIKNVILGPVLLLIDLVTGNFTKLKEDALNIWMNIQNAAASIWSGIKQTVGSLAQGLVNHVVLLLTGLKNTMGNIWSSAKNTASSAWNGLKNLVVSIAGNLKQAAVSAFQNMVAGIRSALFSIGSVVSGGFQSAISFITSLPGKALQWGKDFINGIANGIRSAIGNVVSAVSDVANKIRSFLHFSVPDEGPLTDYESWMPDFMGGLARGIEKGRGMVKKAMESVAADMVLSPKMGAVGYDTAGGGYGGVMSMADLVSSLTAAVTEAVGGISGQPGDIVIPVYIGGTLLDEVVVSV